MLYLSLTPHVSTIRFYDQPDGYENRVPYIGIMTITHLSDTTAYISGALGNFDKAAYTQVMALLKEHGVKTLLYERRGKFITRDL